MKSIADSLEKINDKLNPIVVKELRQAVQGKFLIVVVNLFSLPSTAYCGTILNQ